MAGLDDSIQALLFDFGGVLAEEGFRNGLVAMATEQGLDVTAMPGEGMRAVYDSGFVLGRGSVAEFWTLLRQRTGLTGDDDALTETILSGFIIRPSMIMLVRQLRAANYVTGILSDQTYWLDSLDEIYHFYTVFDRVYNSYYLGKGKQDPALFSEVASDLGMTPSEILLVDDDPGNVQRARSAGWHAICYVDQQSLVAEMASLGIRSM